VHHAARVREVNGVAQRHGDAQVRLEPRAPTSVQVELGLAPQQCGPRHPLDALHHHQGPTVSPQRHGVDGQNAGVLERARQPGLGQQRLGVGHRALCLQRLQGHRPTQAHLARQLHHAHAALPQHRLLDVGAVVVRQPLHHLERALSDPGRRGSMVDRGSRSAVFAWSGSMVASRWDTRDPRSESPFMSVADRSARRAEPQPEPSCTAVLRDRPGCYDAPPCTRLLTSGLRSSRGPLSRKNGGGPR